MIVEKANIEDAALLTELRLEYLSEDHGELSENDVEIIRRDLPNYYRKNLNHNIFCYLIREDEEIVSCAFLLVVEKPMSPAFITGRTGTVMNVYTKPQYRHKGYAKGILNKLLSDAKENNVSVVELKSTEDGYHLYRSVGFTDEVSKYHSMKWYNQ